MGQNEHGQESGGGDGGDEKREKSQKVAEYLQAPRRKRKSFVLLALGAAAHAEFATGIEQFVRGNFKAAAIATPRSVDDLVRAFGRQVVLLIFDDEFTDLDTGLGLVRDLKRRKNSTGVPVLFLTRHPERLVEAYNKQLLAYHEGDDYVNHAKHDLPVILSKVRAGLTGGYRRRSRRYEIDLGLKYDLLTDGKRYPGRMLDLSVHGALIRSEDGRIFKAGEQLKLHVPVASFLGSDKGDYLRLSARVRRVFISGLQAGVSFEHTSDGQLRTLTELLIGIVDDQTMKALAAAKARAATR